MCYCLHCGVCLDMYLILSLFNCTWDRTDWGVYWGAGHRPSVVSIVSEQMWNDFAVCLSSLGHCVSPLWVQYQQPDNLHSHFGWVGANALCCVEVDLSGLPSSLRDIVLAVLWYFLVAGIKPRKWGSYVRFASHCALLSICDVLLWNMRHNTMLGKTQNTYPHHTTLHNTHFTNKGCLLLLLVSSFGYCLYYID